MQFYRLLPRYDQSSDMANASSKISDASNAGNQAINSYDPTAAGNTSSNVVGQNFDTAQGQNAQGVDPLAAQIAKNPTVTSLYQQGNSLYNVPQLASQATNLQNTMNNVQPAGYAAAKGFDIDNTDINNGIAAKTAYLTPELNQAENNYNTASGLASNFVNAGVQQNTQNLIPAQTNAQMTIANQAAEATGWNQAQKATLDGLMQKMQSGVQLSQTEMQTAQALAQTEESYNQQMQSNQEALTASELPYTQGMPISNTQTYYNPSTNKDSYPVQLAQTMGK